MDEDTLHYSHEKLSSFLGGAANKDVAFKEYLANLKYRPVKDFAPGLEWFNVSEPLSFAKHLKGKVVLLDFFTYCCINCMHIIPDLREIEQMFTVEDGLVVIGVHSAKFENEKQSSNILSAVQRYNIAHPVVNDHKFDMWKNCDVHCWPTLLLLDPNANPIVMLMGEGHKGDLQLYIRNALDYYKLQNQISNHSLPMESAYHLLPNLKGPLLFPGKITSFSDGNGDDILAVSDSGNHRILILNSAGVIMQEIGGNKAGFLDGLFSETELNGPQGIVFQNRDTLFVADTENHAIRRVDLKRGIVETVAGTGVQGDDKKGGKLGREQEISSPWDLCIYRTADLDLTFYPEGNPPLRDVLIIAMAGTHQIWALFLSDTVWWKCQRYPAGTLLCIAGSGREENRNNAYPQSAAFAQPSGLALSMRNKEVYVADSESSSVRRLSLVDGKVTGVCGGDRNPTNLFAFGDQDGVLHEAKLQHALGLALSTDETTLYVVDTYNHKLKKIDLAQNRLITLSTSNQTSKKVFNEPAGICISPSSNKRLYLADTNSHTIKIIELDSTSQRIAKIDKLEVTFGGQQSPGSNKSKPRLVYAASQSINVNSKQGGKVIVAINVVFENELSLTEDAPQSWIVDLPNAAWSCVPSSGVNVKDVDVVVSVPAATPGSTSSDNIDFIFNFVTCTADKCLPKNFVVRLPVVYKTDQTCLNIRSKLSLVLDPSDVKVLNDDINCS